MIVDPKVLAKKILAAKEAECKVFYQVLKEALQYEIFTLIADDIWFEIFQNQITFISLSTESRLKISLEEYNEGCFRIHISASLARLNPDNTMTPITANVECIYFGPEKVRLIRDGKLPYIAIARVLYSKIEEA